MNTTRLIPYILVTILCGCAAQSDVIILDERLTQMESRYDRQNAEIRKYGKNSTAKEKKLRNQSAGLRVQLDALREEIQILNGKLEEIQFMVSQEKKSLEDSDKIRKAQVERLKESTAAIDSRIARIEKYLDIGATGTIAGGLAGAKTKAKRTGEGKLSEQELYQLAKHSFDKGDFEAARESFQELIKQYPKSKNADNAQFWIGEIYYREKWYEKAIVEYQKVVENYPKGNKVMSSLLKQGYAFNNIGDKSNARLILKELIRKYPQSNEAKIAKQKLQQIK